MKPVLQVRTRMSHESGLPEMTMAVVQRFSSELWWQPTSICVSGKHFQFVYADHIAETEVVRKISWEEL